MRTHYKKRTIAAELNLWGYFKDAGNTNDCVGVLRVSFPSDITAQEANHRWQRWWYRQLRPFFYSYVRVLEAQKSGRPHFHVILKTRYDLYNHTIRGMIHRYMRKGAKQYGIGLTKLEPLIFAGDRITNYLLKDIRNGRTQRIFPGCRPITYSSSFKKTCSSQFSLNTPASRRWRKNLRDWARTKRVNEYNIRDRLGVHWYYWYKDEIRRFSELPVFKKQLAYYFLVNNRMNHFREVFLRKRGPLFETHAIPKGSQQV